MSQWEIATDDDDAPRLPVVRPPRNNFVAPIPEPQRYELTPPQPHELMSVPSVQHVVTMHTTHVDRAKGFAIQTGILSVVVGVLAIVAAVALFGQPLLTFWIFVWFFAGFCAVWIMAYLWDRWTSPDGIALFQVFGGFRLLRKEQDFRHEYLRHQAGMPQRWERKARSKATTKGRR